MKLTVLGCGDAFASEGRNHTSFLIDHEEGSVLIDCGATTLVRLRQERIPLSRVSTILITHFHGDHYGGLPFLLISSLFEDERKEPLLIAGPPGVKERVYALQGAMYPGTPERLDGLDLRFYEFETNGDALHLEDKIIRAWTVEHSPPSLPHGVRLEWKGKTVAFSGDTSWTDHLIPLSSGADLFICECNFYDQDAFGHLSYRELLSKRSLLECENLWLTHMGTRVIHEEDISFNRLEDGMKLDF